MGSNQTTNQGTISARLPPIHRARGYHLYDLHGRRYLDLCLQGGRALLGHRPESALLELKNLSARGLLGDFPSPYEARLRKSLRALLPAGFDAVRVFRSEERLVAAVAPLVESREVIDPVLASEPPTSPLQRWRPFLSNTAPEGAAAVLLPVLPFPGSFAPAVACFRGIAEDRLPPSDPVSPALLGALVRSAYLLARAVQTASERPWAGFEAPWWRRVGPYLVAQCEKSEYSELFGRLLEEGIYLNPEFPGPSIVPMEHSPGELKPLKRAAAKWAAERERA